MVVSLSEHKPISLSDDITFNVCVYISVYIYIYIGDIDLCLIVQMIDLHTLVLELPHLGCVIQLIWLKPCSSTFHRSWEPVQVASRASVAFSVVGPMTTVASQKELTSVVSPTSDVAPQKAAEKDPVQEKRPPLVALVCLIFVNIAARLARKTLV